MTTVSSFGSLLPLSLKAALHQDDAEGALSFCRKVTMNGRCETDPLDRAIDVCDRCYGEFCETHLVQPKGRKQPFCSDCALTASGVRGSARIEPRGDRRTAKRRRKELREAVVHDEQVFEFFDYEAADDSPGRDDVDSAPTPDLEPTTHLEPAADDDPERTDPESPGPGSTTPPVEADEGSDTKSSEPGDGELRRSVDPIPLEDTPPTPAVAQLEKLRREAQERARSAVGGGSDSVDDAEPPSERTPETPPRTAPAPVRAPLPNRQSTRPSAPAADAERVSAAEEIEQPRLTTSGERAVDRRQPAPAPTHRRPTAPTIGEVRNVAGRRTDDNRTQAASGQHRPQPGGVAPGGALNAVDGFDADRQDRVPRPTAPPPAPRPGPTAAGRPVGAEAPIDAGSPDAEGGTNSTTPAELERSADIESKGADVDDRGNWVPPILRGISPDAAEAKANLPQRRR